MIGRGFHHFGRLSGALCVFVFVTVDVPCVCIGCRGVVVVVVVVAWGASLRAAGMGCWFSQAELLLLLFLFGKRASLGV